MSFGQLLRVGATMVKNTSSGDTGHNPQLAKEAHELITYFLRIRDAETRAVMIEMARKLSTDHPFS